MIARSRLLLIDDDNELAWFLAERLRRDGYDVAIAHSGADGLRELDERWPDLVVLDLMLPDMTGTATARAIKERADLPIIVLSAITDTAARVDLIERFAEDFLVKPFHYPELRARVERVLDRLQDRIPSQEVEVAPELTLLLRRREALVGGALVRLTPIETRLLAVLAAARGKPVSTERLLQRVWGDADGAEPVYVWVTVHRLRQKLERDPRAPHHLHSRRGGGYSLGLLEPDHDALAP